jgi:hypothetical protein
VQEGRVVYDNIRRFIKYLLTCNASEIAVMLVGPLLGMPLPLQPLQILWMNLVTDGLPALALGVEPAEADVMRRPPQAATKSIFGRGMVPFIVVLGAIASLVSIGVGLLAYLNGDAGRRPADRHSGCGVRFGRGRGLEMGAAARSAGARRWRVKKEVPARPRPRSAGGSGASGVVCSVTARWARGTGRVPQRATDHDHLVCMTGHRRRQRLLPAAVAPSEWPLA